MSVTTMPDTSGVMMRRVYFNSRLITTSTSAATIQQPKIMGSPPMAPMVMMGPMKEKLVPSMQSIPVPTGPTRRHCTKVAIPDAKNAIDTRKAVVEASKFTGDDEGRCGDGDKNGHQMLKTGKERFLHGRPVMKTVDEFLHFKYLRVRFDYRLQKYTFYGEKLLIIDFFC